MLAVAVHLHVDEQLFEMADVCGRTVKPRVECVGGELRQPYGAEVLSEVCRGWPAGRGFACSLFMLRALAADEPDGRYFPE